MSKHVTSSRSGTSKMSWYIFFSIALIALLTMSLAASMQLTAMSQEMRSQAQMAEPMPE